MPNSPIILLAISPSSPNIAVVVIFIEIGFDIHLYGKIRFFNLA